MYMMNIKLKKMPTMKPRIVLKKNKLKLMRRLSLELKLNKQRLPPLLL